MAIKMKRYYVDEKTGEKVEIAIKGAKENYKKHTNLSIRISDEELDEIRNLCQTKGLRYIDLLRKGYEYYSYKESEFSKFAR